MKKLVYIIFLITCLFLIGCKPTSNLFYGTGVNPTGVKQAGVDTFTVVQIDSMLTADNLPAITSWVSTNMKDFETGYQYVYYTLYDKSTLTIYTVKALNTSTARYVVQKRKLSNQ